MSLGGVAGTRHPSDVPPIKTPRGGAALPSKFKTVFLNSRFYSCPGTMTATRSHEISTDNPAAPLKLDNAVVSDHSSSP